MFLWPKWILFFFSVFCLLKISENKTQQIIEPQPLVVLVWESLDIMWEHIWPLRQWLTGCVSEKEPMNSMDYWFCCNAVLLKTLSEAIMGYLLLCNFVLFWHIEVRRFPWDKKRAAIWLWLTAQNIETIIHWDHLCKKRNPEIFSPWGFSCKRLLLFVLILVCKLSLSFPLLAHSASYK